MRSRCRGGGGGGGGCGRDGRGAGRRGRPTWVARRAAVSVSAGDGAGRLAAAITSAAPLSSGRTGAAVLGPAAGSPAPAGFYTLSAIAAASPSDAGLYVLGMPCSAPTPPPASTTQPPIPKPSPATSIPSSAGCRGKRHFHFTPGPALRERQVAPVRAGCVRIGACFSFARGWSSVTADSSHCARGRRVGRTAATASDMVGGGCDDTDCPARPGSRGTGSRGGGDESGRRMGCQVAARGDRRVAG
jgi:hypothetical protein